ncbi:MAG: hypothetical protein HC902_03850 [Calothrix sp. SM1_5_4]|nr:hypothetical protein [Calothrix sp. SM1_5_4]
MRSPSYFPIRLFRWFLTQQILFSGIFFVLLSLALFVWVESSGLEADTLSVTRAVVSIALSVAFLIMIGVSIFMARRLVIPLGRLIEKTRRLREIPLQGDDVEPEDMSFDEPGEWYELERALNRWSGSCDRRRSVFRARRPSCGRSCRR